MSIVEVFYERMNVILYPHLTSKPKGVLANFISLVIISISSLISARVRMPNINKWLSFYVRDGIPLATAVTQSGMVIISHPKYFGDH